MRRTNLVKKEMALAGPSEEIKTLPHQEVDVTRYAPVKILFH